MQGEAPTQGEAPWPSAAAPSQGLETSAPPPGEAPQPVAPHPARHESSWALAVAPSRDAVGAPPIPFAAHCNGGSAHYAAAPVPVPMGGTVSSPATPPGPTERRAALTPVACSLHHPIEAPTPPAGARPQPVQLPPPVRAPSPTGRAVPGAWRTPTLNRSVTPRGSARKVLNSVVPFDERGVSPRRSDRG